MAKLFANRGDPDQAPHSAASDLGLHCLPFTLLRVSRLQWVNPLVHLVLIVWNSKYLNLSNVKCNFVSQKRLTAFNIFLSFC